MKDETGADQNPDMIDIQSVSPAFLNHYNARGPDKKVSFCQFGEYIANEKTTGCKTTEAHPYYSFFDLRLASAAFANRKALFWLNRIFQTLHVSHRIKR
jgi:hypothetical protein